MSKKRVHEIAKELKEKHGIEFDNKQVVTELMSLGYDVKSHSSSLEDDQAIAAVQKIVEKRKPKAAPAPVAPKGFVVRRKVGESTVATPFAAGAKVDMPHEKPAAVAAHVEPEPVVDLPADTHTAVAQAVPPANMPAATEHKAVETAAPTTTTPPPEVPMSPVVEASAPVAAVAATATAAVAATPAAEVPPPPRSAPRARASAPRPGAISVAPLAAAPPPLAVPPMVRPASTITGPRPSSPRVGVTMRPSIGPAGATATGPAAPVRTVPTATQAVVVSRPLIPIKRVTPNQPTAGRYPMAPGKKAIGVVREFKVVPGGTGRREGLRRRPPQGSRATWSSRRRWPAP